MERQYKKKKKKKPPAGQQGQSGIWEVASTVPEEEEEQKQSSRALLAGQAGSSGSELRAWLSLVPDFDGSPHELERFVATVRYVSSRLPASEERGLLLGLGAKLRRRARALLSHRLHRFASVEELLDQLRAYFSGLGAEAALLEQMRSIRQRPKEAVEEFGLRLDRLVTQLSCIYQQSQNVSENMRLLQEAALASFRRGLRSSELELHLAACQPKNLEEALATAIVLDNQLRGCFSARSSWDKRELDKFPAGVSNRKRLRPK